MLPATSEHRLDLDPEIRAFAASSDRRFNAEFDALPPAEQRRLYNAWCLEWSSPRPNELSVADFLVPTDEAKVPVRLYRRRDCIGNLPVVLYMHGGGWVLGSPETHDQVTSNMALATGAVVLSVDYRLAPEHKFPAAFNDCYGVLSWLVEAGPGLGIDPSRLAVAGDSAGANLAAALSLAARDRQGPAIAFQALIYPGLRFQRPAGIDADSPGLAAESISVYAKAYLAKAADATHPYAAPLHARDFSKLPPAYIAAAWFDVLREDSSLYAEKLREAGVEATYQCAPGLVHTYLRTIHCCAAAQKEFLAVCHAIKKALT
ncbi:alpha/beta hydrolase [Dongia soli]|uniref:Alpha/beta hydrolase n=1 Tax=Dongia soli TaxID=600628 RepID=A0ABU5E8U2_9PROT|nr:alpha/beta hydrolase [Dongia soli]MDY0882581.1 alpha/beta hydrolase [Dongia soli]